jgi:hypothetical protein
MVTVLGQRTVEGRGDGDRLLVDDLEAAIGWELKPEGLCRDEMCVPVREQLGDPPDLRAVAAALGQRIVVDDGRGVAAVSVDMISRRRTIESGEAVPFELPDLDGTPRSLGEWSGKKKLLVCWASW